MYELCALACTIAILVLTVLVATDIVKSPGILREIAGYLKRIVDALEKGDKHG